jgi:hypothetical protein
MAFVHLHSSTTQRSTVNSQHDYRLHIFPMTHVQPEILSTPRVGLHWHDLPQIRRGRESTANRAIEARLLQDTPQIKQLINTHPKTA